MRRRLLNLLTLLSLVVCVASAALWVRSLWAGDYVAWHGTADGTPRERLWMLASGRGRLSVASLRVDVPAFTAEELAESGYDDGRAPLPAGFQARFGGVVVPPGGF